MREQPGEAMNRDDWYQAGYLAYQYGSTSHGRPVRSMKDAEEAWWDGWVQASNDAIGKDD